jgi:hypothetical protein
MSNISFGEEPSLICRDELFGDIDELLVQDFGVDFIVRIGEGDRA